MPLALRLSEGFEGLDEAATRSKSPIRPVRFSFTRSILTLESDPPCEDFDATEVLSYKVFLFTLYSLGLRLGEGLAHPDHQPLHPSHPSHPPHR